MSQQSKGSRSVDGSTPHRGGRERMFGVFFQGQNCDREAPDEFVTLGTAKFLVRAGACRFIKRNTALLRTNACIPHDPKEYEPGKGRPESLHPNEALMTRFVAGDVLAIEAINAWA